MEELLLILESATESVITYQTLTSFVSTSILTIKD
jgi:hypothetical protein